MGMASFTDDPEKVKEEFTGLSKLASTYQAQFQESPFILSMGEAYAAADFVLTRAGLSTITELSNLGKVSIIIPMPGTHQEYNGFILDKLKAALVLRQKIVTPVILIKLLKALMFDIKTQKIIAEGVAGIMPRNSAKKISQIIIDLAQRHAKE